MTGGHQGPVRQERLGAVLVLVMDNPPVNALGHALRAALAAGLDRAEADPAIGSVLLLAEGRSFPAGADISEFGKPPKSPSLPELCSRIEDCSKPVIAALHGTALGGGLELALAAHQRVALAEARLGLPEVGLGLLPGAGGTQRLPRLIGAEQALRMILSGRPVTAADAMAMGFVDQVVEADLPEAGYAMAAAAVGQVPRPTRDRREGLRDGVGYGIAISKARVAVRDAALAAPERIVDCVEAALLLPFDQGLAFERAAFADLVALPEAEALRHAFFAERRAAKIPGARAQARAVAEVTVLGAGPAGATAALAFLRAGYAVALAAKDQADLVPGMERIAATLEADVAAGRLAATTREKIWARLAPALADMDMGGVDLLVLADEFAVDGAALPDLPGCPVVTLARSGGAGGALGLGLVLRPNGSPGVAPGGFGGGLAEVLVEDSTSPEAVATLWAVLRRMGLCVVQAQGAGLVRPLETALRAARRVLEAAHGVQAMTEVAQRWGLVAGPDGKRRAAPADVVFAGLGAPLIGALANAGLRLLGEGHALRPSDIDLVAMTGLGLPRWSGGPMLWAQRRGPFLLRADLERWAEISPSIWTPAPLVDQLIREGVSLSALNEG